MTHYLDNAATTYPKPDGVMKAFLESASYAYGNAGRASHQSAASASALLFDAREKIANHFGAECERVVFSENATHALNLAIHALTPDRSHLLLSDIEHNAVLRPVHALASRGVTYSLFQSFAENGRDREAMLSSLEKNLRPNTVGVIACHRSNCLPVELDLVAIGDFCRRHQLFFIVDAAQSAGSAVIDMQKAHITALCAPSHKGLYGLRGAGFAIFSKDVRDTDLLPLTLGGSGGDSRLFTMPDYLPERLEAGTRPIEIIAALSKGVDFVTKTTPDEIRRKEEYLSRYLKDRLLKLPFVRVYFPRRDAVGCLLFNLSGQSASSVAEALSERGIALRDGLHCAPLAHRHTKTEKIGALRASFGYFNTEDDADALVYALKDVAMKKG